MSVLDTIIGDALAPYALITRQGRAIGSIIPDVVIEEGHQDTLTITQHPVETGAAISDHAFKNPAELEMRIGFSDSTAGAVGASQEAYQELLVLQATREPFNVSTGKRQYTEMLIASLSVTTDQKSEHALNCVVGLRQVIRTSTSGSGSAGTDAQTNPQTTAPVAETGQARLSETSIPAFAAQALAGGRRP